MNTLVIGGGGFVGAYLIAELNAGGHRVHATKLPGEEIRGTCTIHDLDILQPEAVSALLEQLKPDWIFHLAAQSSVALSWKRPQLTVDVNVKGTLNLLEAVRRLAHQPECC